MYKDQITFASYWLPVILFLAAQFIVVVTLIINNRVRQAERNKEFELQINQLNKDNQQMRRKMDYMHDRIDTILEKVSHIEILLERKQDK